MIYLRCNEIGVLNKELSKKNRPDGKIPLEPAGSSPLIT